MKHKNHGVFFLQFTYLFLNEITDLQITKDGRKGPKTTKMCSKTQAWSMRRGSISLSKRPEEAARSGSGSNQASLGSVGFKEQTTAKIREGGSIVVCQRQHGSYVAILGQIWWWQQGQREGKRQWHQKRGNGVIIRDGNENMCNNVEVR